MSHYMKTSFALSFAVAAIIASYMLLVDPPTVRMAKASAQAAQSK